MSDKVLNGVPRELLERTICRLTHGHEHDKAVRELRALLAAQPQASALTEAAPGCFVQPVPSHCDRITWRGNYYQLPDGLTQASAAQSAPAGEREAVEVVGYRVSMPGEPELGSWLDEEAESEPQIQNHEPLMTVAQHERILSAWQRTQAAGVPDALREAVEYLDDNRFNQIGAGSILHRAMRDALAAPAQPASPAQSEKVAHSAQWPTTPGLSARPSEAQRLREALRITRDTIDSQLEIIASRAAGNYLDKLPVVRSLKAHRARCDAALAASTGQEVGK